MSFKELLISENSLLISISLCRHSSLSMNFLWGKTLTKHLSSVKNSVLWSRNLRAISQFPIGVLLMGYPVDVFVLFENFETRRLIMIDFVPPLDLWQFHVSSKRWNWSKSFRSWELEMLTSSFHPNWKWSPAHFIWTENVDQFIWGDWRNSKSLFLLSEDFRQVISSAVQMKWTGERFQFRWSELVNIFSSYKLELKTHCFDSVHTK